ncbi:MAG: hypothetical protein QGH15_23975, partial [Kiritimatiellia bacterium]|nr:hypothetical protein [Kiritimatiellia bacterium]
MNEDYVKGFMSKAAELGVDPERLVKSSIAPAEKPFGYEAGAPGRLVDRLSLMLTGTRPNI